MTEEAGNPGVIAQQPMHALAPDEAIRQAWKIAAVAGGLLFACLVIAHWDTAVGLIRLWGTDAYGHGPFVFAASGYLIWRRRDLLYGDVPRPALSGAILLVVISAGWFLIHVMVMRAGRELLFVASFSAIVLSVSGWRALRILAFPLAYVFLAISAWDVLLVPLQTATAILSTDLLQLLGLPVFRETHYIDVPMGRFLVEKACAGLRTFLAGMAVGLLYAYISYRSAWRWMVFLVLTTVWALAVNVLRVAITVAASFPLGMHNFVYRNHGTLGWILFGVGLIPLFTAGRWLSIGEYPAPDATSSSLPTVESQPRIRKTAALILAAGIAIVLAPVSTEWLLSAGHAEQIKLPTVINVAPPWQVKAGGTPSWRPVFHGNDGTLHLTYENPNGREVWLYTSYYANERPGSKLIFFANRLYDPTDWQAVQSRTLHVSLYGQRLPIREIYLVDPSGTHHRILWFWYRVAGANTTTRLDAKLLRIRSIFYPGASAVIAIASDVTTAPASTRRALQEVLRGVYPSIVKALDKDRTEMTSEKKKPD